MREYFVDVETTIKYRKIVRIEAESELKAKDIANMQGGVGADDADTIETVTRILSVEENPYIDQYGNPYIEDESFPAGGGLHRDCEFNADALYAFYVPHSRDKITAYLTSKGFTPFTQGEDYEEWEKGNTLVTYETYDHSAGQWGYMRTELIREPNMVM